MTIPVEEPGIVPDGRQLSELTHYSTSTRMVYRRRILLATRVRALLGLSLAAILTLTVGVHRLFADGTIRARDVPVDSTTIPVGGGPLAVVVNPKGKYAYLAKNGGDTVSIIGAASNHVTETVPLRISPTSLAISPNGRTLYVSSDLGATTNMRPAVAIINASTGKVTKYLNVGGASDDVIFSPNGLAAYVAGSSGITIIDTATQRISGTISVAPNPQTIAISPDGQTLYVVTEYSITSRPAGSLLQVVNVATRTVQSTIHQNGLAPFGLAVNPRGSALYETFAGGASVTNVAVKVLNTSTNKIVSTILIAAGARGVAFSPNGKQAYVCNADGSGISVINTASPSIERTIGLNTASLGPQPWAIAINPDGSRAYITNFAFLDRTLGTVTVLDLAKS